MFLDEMDDETSTDGGTATPADDSEEKDGEGTGEAM